MSPAAISRGHRGASQTSVISPGQSEIISFAWTNQVISEFGSVPGNNIFNRSILHSSNDSAMPRKKFRMFLQHPRLSSYSWIILQFLQDAFHSPMLLIACGTFWNTQRLPHSARDCCRPQSFCHLSGTHGSNSWNPKKRFESFGNVCSSQTFLEDFCDWQHTQEIPETILQRNSRQWISRNHL
jgi:hypothetical protein